MREKHLCKRATLSERLIEKCLEWYEFLRYTLFRREKTWSSHLVEYYCIHRNFHEQKFVQDFLEERKNILSGNKHRMVINVIPDDSNACVVGKVQLYNKGKYIHEATLKIRKPFTGDNIIFWSFDK